MAKRPPALLIAVAALGGLVDPESFEKMLERGLDLHEVATASGCELYVDAGELLAFMLAL